MSVEALDITIEQPAKLNVTVTPPAPIQATLVVGQGPAGPSGVATPAFEFAYGDASPSLIGPVLAGQRIVQLVLSIDVAFTGTGPAISIGTMADPNLLVAAGLIDPATVAVYDLAPQELFLADTLVYLFITPGAGGLAGSGSIIYQRQ